MNARLPRIVHVAPRVQALGGIESLLALHRQMPQTQAYVALFDRRAGEQAGYANLNFNWRTPLWLMRRRFARTLAPYAGSLVVYHNGWGLPLFHDLDASVRRLVYLHANPAYHARDLPAFAGLVDGAVGVTPALNDAWQTVLPELTPDRTIIVRAPIEAPAPPTLRRERNEPLVLGYAGRIERAQKRLDRLPELLRALVAAGLSCRFEILGDGAFRAPLERKLASRVRFHGYTPKAEFWRVLANWDGIVFFSDFEGGAVALFEAMAMGVVPFYPAIGGSWGDIYVPQIDSRCLYRPGDMAGLAWVIQQVFQSPAEQLGAMRARGRELVKEHRRDSYEAAFLGLAQIIAKLPRISGCRRRRSRVTDLLPLGFVTRFAPWALRLA